MEWAAKGNSSCLGLFYVNTAVSTKVVPQKCKSVMSIGIMGRIVRVLFCLIEVQGDSATRKEKDGIHVFVLFPSSTLKNLEVHSSNCEKHHYP